MRQNIQEQHLRLQCR